MEFLKIFEIYIEDLITLLPINILYLYDLRAIFAKISDFFSIEDLVVIFSIETALDIFI